MKVRVFSWVSLNFFVLLFLSNLALAGGNQKFMRVAILDTAHQEQALYQPFLDLAHLSLIKMDYIGLPKFIDMNADESLKAYDGIMILLSKQFLRTMNNSAVAKKFLSLLEVWSKKQNKLIGLAMPPLPGKGNQNVAHELRPLLAALGIKVPGYKKNSDFLSIQTRAQLPDVMQKHKQSFDSFFYLFNWFVQSPVETRPINFHTTLSAPHGGRSFYNQTVVNVIKQQKGNVRSLPLRSSLAASPIAQQTLPYGLYWFNPLYENHIFVTTTSMVAFSGIEENFRITPLDFPIRSAMLQGLQQMLTQLKGIVQEKISGDFQFNYAPKEKTKELMVPQIGKPHRAKQKSSLQKIAWMELVSFEDKEYKPDVGEEQKQKKERELSVRRLKLVEYILEAKLDALWISLTPNIIYSKIAKYPKREKKFLQSLARFTKMLNETAKHNKSKLPKILVGFEIADNLYDNNKPVVPAKDIYGNEYFDVPYPLDQNFWQEEIINSLQKFLAKWSDSEISHGLKIGGVVIDLEMYGRKTTGTFFETMGFARPVINEYVAANKLERMEPQKFVAWLIKNKRVSDYYNYLSQRALSVGLQLKKGIRNVLPGASISCYAPAIHANWFYKGLYQGLGEQGKPVHLCTFNMEYQAHKKWFVDNNINATHACVLLLSKIRNTADFNQVKTILKHHEGIWLNRFSRLVEPYQARSWIGVEQTPISDRDKLKFMKYVAEE